MKYLINLQTLQSQQTIGEAMRGVTRVRNYFYVNFFVKINFPGNDGYE